MKRSILFFGIVILVLVLALPQVARGKASSLPESFYYPVRQFRGDLLPNGSGLSYDSARGVLLVNLPGSTGRPGVVRALDRVLEEPRGETAAGLAGILAVEGKVTDDSGLQYQLDAEKLIIRVTGGAGTSARLIPLRGLRDLQPHGLARDPRTSRIYTSDTSGDSIIELDADGKALSVLNLASAGLRLTGGMVFAPSGDETDDPAEYSLYLIAQGDGMAGSQVFELTLVEPVRPIESGPVLNSLVRTIAAWQWDPPSPDTSGISYWPDKDGFLVSDGEVETMHDKNLFLMEKDGTLHDTYTTILKTSPQLYYSNEPTGVAVNFNNNEIYISDDVKRRVFVVNIGEDGELQTDDDVITSFSTYTNGKYVSPDPEGVGWGNGRLYIVDGTNAEVYVISPGPNKKFDGVSPSGDDILVTSFDTEWMGLADPEGIDFNPFTGTLFIAGNNSRSVLIECTTSGEPVHLYDVSRVRMSNPAGLAIGPSSTNPSGFSVYITDRGADFDGNNDGRIFEIDLSNQPILTLTPTPSATATFTATPTMTASPTLTATPTFTPTITFTPAPILAESLFLPFVQKP